MRFRGVEFQRFLGSFFDVISGCSLEATFWRFSRPPGVYVEVSGGAFWGQDRCWELLGLSMDFWDFLGSSQSQRSAKVGGDLGGIWGPNQLTSGQQTSRLQTADQQIDRRADLQIR